MEQVLEALQSQLAQHQVTLSSLSDSIVRLNHAVTYTAGTPDADGDSLVRLPFMNERLKSFEVAAEMDQSRLQIFTREISDLRRMVTDANDAVHQRIDGERSTSLATMENLDKGYATLRDLVSLRHGESKEDRESLKSQIRTLEERVSGLRTSPGWGTSRICLTRQKGFDHLKHYNGEGGIEKWKEWRFGILTWIDQESPTLARLIRRVEKLESEPKEPED